MKRTMFCALLLLVPGAAFAEPFAGKWVIDRELPVGRMRTTLELNQVGDRVTGIVSVLRGRAPPMHQQIHGARVEGKTLTFYVWTGRDEPLKDIYKGVLNDKGEISFEVQRGVGPPRAVPPLPNGGANSPAPAEPTQVTAVPLL